MFRVVENGRKEFLDALIASVGKPCRSTKEPLRNKITSNGILIEQKHKRAKEIKINAHTIIRIGFK
jgi:hypothetical protein